MNLLCNNNIMCTGIFAVTADNKYVFGRTLEFGIPLKWKQFCSFTIKGTMGKFDGINEWFITDGVNVNGFFVGTFYFPHYHFEYAKEKVEGKINLETGYVNSFLLKHCKSVDDVKKIAHKLNIIETVLNNTKFSFHWLLCDKTGKCAVMEIKNKEVQIYDNPYHVITNSPKFTEQITNVNKYKYLSRYNKPDSISQGSGALGMPGDSTSLSRFVRAHFFRQNMVIPKNDKTGIEAILRILHNFDIPLGSVEDKKTKELEVTEYTVVYCLNTMEVKYAPYGYIKKNNEWIQTDHPVELYHNNVISTAAACLIILGCVMYKANYNI